MRTRLATSKPPSYTTPQQEQEKARRYIQQVAAEVQQLYQSKILSGIKNDAQRMAVAKHIVSKLLSASWREWRSSVWAEIESRREAERLRSKRMNESQQSLFANPKYKDAKQSEYLTIPG